MKMRFALLLTFVLFSAALSSADTLVFTPGSSDVYYSVNNPNGGGSDFWVSGSPINGAYASAGSSASSFQLSATDPSYSDAGIVLFFNGGLTLGQLQSVNVVTTNPSAMNINLWLDTGGDGKFFRLDGTGLLTGLNGDAYGGHSGPVLAGADDIQMFQGQGTHSLVYFQSGAASGIRSNTPVALWVGITSAGVSAEIDSITLNATPEPASVVLLGGGLIGIVMALRRKRA
jgi:hypothetical protein